MTTFAREGRRTEREILSSLKDLRFPALDPGHASVTSGPETELLRETCADAISHPSEWYETPRTPPDAPLSLMDFISTLIGWALAVLAIILVAHWLTGGHWR